MTREDRIFALSRVWSDARYNFVFWFRVNIDWDAEYRAALERVSGDISDIDFYLELARLLTLLGDGHTMVRFPPDIIAANLLPVKFSYIDNQHIIANVARGLEIPIFARLISINGKPTAAYFEENVFPYCWHEKADSVFASGQAYSLIPLIEKGEITIETDVGIYDLPRVSGDIEWREVKPIAPSEPLEIIADAHGIKLSVTRDNICVIDIRDFMDDTMPAHFYSLLDSLAAMRGFVIDIRGNRGGHSQNADALAQAFIAGEFPNERARHRIHIGAYYAWGVHMDFDSCDMSDAWSKKVSDICNGNYFEDEITAARFLECPRTLNQPVIILEDAATWSSAENLLVDFDNARRATIMGSASYGSTGNPLAYELPGGGMACICTRYCLYPDGRDFINTGVKPHVECALALNDIKTGVDSVLNRALAALRGKTREY